MSTNGHNGNGYPKPMGRRPTMTLEAERQVYAILTVGGSLADAADFLGIDRSTMTKHKQENPRFSQGVDRAAAKGKLKLVKKVGKAKPWQAAAWMLERKWGREYGKRDTVEHEHVGGVEVTHKFDDERFADLYRERTRGDRISAGETAANGN